MTARPTRRYPEVDISRVGRPRPMFAPQIYVPPVRIEEVRAPESQTKTPIAERFFAMWTLRSLGGGAAGNTARFQLRNPARSPVDVVWEYLILWSSGTRFYELSGPLTGLAAADLNNSVAAGWISGFTNPRQVRAIGRSPFALTSIQYSGGLTLFSFSSVEANTPFIIPLELISNGTAFDSSWRVLLGDTAQTLATDSYNVGIVWKETAKT